MTPEEHNKYLAYSHFGYAAFQLLMMLMMTLFFSFIAAMIAADPHGGDAPPAAFFVVFMVFMLIFQLLFAVPSVVAGFGLLKRKEWAKTAGIIAGVMSAMSFPVGTAVCVYTFWFLLGEGGKALYSERPAEKEGRPLSFLNEASSAANRTDEWRTRRREPAEYVPPKEMPNWRD